MKKTSYYNMDDGLKIRDQVNMETQGQQVSTTIDYSDYKEVSGIKFPFKMTQTMGPQTFDFIVQEIKVNEGVSDLDFE